MTSTADPLDTLRSALADRYTIERELGAGGMATVYLAEDVKHHRKVAIKVLHPELSAVLGSERFLKEIELTANLQHPHILPLFDSWQRWRLAVLRHAVRRRRIAARSTRAREAAPYRRRAPHRVRGRRRAGVRARPRRGPSRHQAREHPAPERACACRRLRHRARRGTGRRRADDADRSLARHAALHGAGTGDGRQAHRTRAPTSTRSAL